MISRAHDISVDVILLLVTYDKIIHFQCPITALTCDLVNGAVIVGLQDVIRYDHDHSIQYYNTVQCTILYYNMQHYNMISGPIILYYYTSTTTILLEFYTTTTTTILLCYTILHNKMLSSTIVDHFILLLDT
jgi:hypothetical protein